jgi:hypothetical protein
MRFENILFKRYIHYKLQGLEYMVYRNLGLRVIGENGYYD